MFRVPKHSVAWRRSNQSSLVVRQQNSQDVSDSAIVVKMLAAGVCGTDLAILNGNRAARAQVLGHEGVGVVLHAPEHCVVTKSARVIVNPVYRQNPKLVIGHSCDGIFRQLFCVDAGDAVAQGLLVPCPDNCTVADTELVLAEPLASVLYSLELLRQNCGDCSLLIRGSGTVGILAARLWAALTGSLAILASKSEGHARWLRESSLWPASVRICGGLELNETIRECSGFLPLKAAILCCSREDAPVGLRLLLDVIRDGATIDLMAGFPAEFRETRLDGINLDEIRWKNICGVGADPPAAATDRTSGKNIFLIGHRGTAERHILEAIELLSRRVISTAHIPHCRLTLEQLPAALNRMKSSQTRHNTKWVKAIVAFSREGPGDTSADS